MSELYHYGIKRRSGRYPWGSGERPFQSANTRESKKLIEATKRSKIYRSERKIPKGTKIYRTTLNPNEKLNTASVSYLEPDRNKYKTQISNRDRTKTSYERELVLTEDLKLPSRQHLKNVVNDEIKKDPTLLDDAIKSAATRRIPKGADSIIIFDMNKSTKPVNTKELTKEDKEKAHDDYYDWARKARNRKDISNW